MGVGTWPLCRRSCPGTICRRDGAGLGWPHGPEWQEAQLLAGAWAQPAAPYVGWGLHRPEPSPGGGVVRRPGTYCGRRLVSCR